MSDMRDDLDELGRGLWPATDALRAKQTLTGAGAGKVRVARNVRRLEPLATLAAAVLLIGVIGGAVVLGRSLSAHTPVPAARSGAQTFPKVGPASPPASGSPSPTGVPVPHTIVWAAGYPGDTLIRVGTASGGFRTVAAIPASTKPSILGAGGHRVLFTQANGHLYDVNIDTRSITDYGGDPGTLYYGAAFSPDGGRVAFLRETKLDVIAAAADLLVLDFNAGSTTTLAHLTAEPFDVPFVWSSAGIAATREDIPSGEQGGVVGFAILDPTTGSAVATTDASAVAASWVIASDGAHAALVDSAAGADPPVVMRTVAIGAPPRGALDENTNHFLRVDALSPDGSTILFSDEPNIGGYAGITLSSDYGLFTLSGGHRVQVAHYNGVNGTFQGGTFLNATSFLVVGSIGANSGTTSTLLIDGSGSLTPLDTAPGGYYANTSVFLVTGR